VPGLYRRREPEKTALHRVVRGHLETLLSEARLRNEAGVGYPAFVEREFRHYVNCGLGMKLLTATAREVQSSG
jgi:hypothetical protein